MTDTTKIILSTILTVVGTAGGIGLACLIMPIALAWGEKIRNKCIKQSDKPADTKGEQ